ncbi:MAG: sulfotransferase [Actinomycetota bacterium]
MAPAHFLVTRRVVTRRLGFLLPEHRPMDAMRLRWGLPQEDEFALGNLGALTPYHAWAFPRRDTAWEQCLDPRDFSEQERRRWQEALLTFYRALTLGEGGRLALKSPPHTARLGLLAEMFPGAAFIHAVRNPYEMIPSFAVAWRRMTAAAGLQGRCRVDLESFLLRLGTHLYRRFDDDRACLGPGRIVDVRYEDLVADPAAELERIYCLFGLARPEHLRPMVAGYLSQLGEYRTNAHEASPGLRRHITVVWGDYARRYGYPLDASTGGLA